jgi:hypothetical protein
MINSFLCKSIVTGEQRIQSVYSLSLRLSPPVMLPFTTVNKTSLPSRQLQSLRAGRVQRIRGRSSDISDDILRGSAKGQRMMNW